MYHCFKNITHRLEPFGKMLAALLALFALMATQANAQVPRPGGANAADDAPQVDYESLPKEDEPAILVVPNIDTNAMLDMLEYFIGKSILRQASVPQVQFNFVSKFELTQSEAILAIESLLALNGIAITDIDENFLKAVPAGTAVNQVPPLILDSTLDLEPSLKIYGKAFKLYFLTVEEATALIQPLVTATVSNSIIQLQKANSLLVTDALLNLQRIEQTLEVLDQPMELSLETLFFQLEFIEASELQKRLENLQSGSLKTRLEFNTTFDADDRTNQLLVFTHPANAKMITDLVDKLDIDVAPLTRTDMYTLKHADAEEVTSIIEQLVTGQQRAREQQEGSANRSNRTGNQNQAGNQNANTNTASASASASDGNKSLQFSDYLTIVADTRSNAILATGTPNDHLYLKKLIEDIDVLLPQVRIEVVIAEVTLGDEIDRGLEAFGFSYDDTGDGVMTFSPSIGGLSFGASTTDSSGNSTSTSGIILGTGNDALDLRSVTIDMVIQAAVTSRYAEVLSAPTIMTTHNQTGTITVGEQRPVVSSTTSNVNSVNTSAVSSNVQFRDIVLELEVTPLIGSNGVVQLEINQKVDTFAGEVEILGAGNQPIINTNQAQSFVSVQDGELIILGGLQRIDQSRNNSRLKGIGQLPVVGPLFGNRDRTVTKRELILFIKPHVIKTTDAAQDDAYDYLENLEAVSKDQIKGYVEDGHFDSAALQETERDRRKRLKQEAKEKRLQEEQAEEAEAGIWIDTGVLDNTETN